MDGIPENAETKQSACIDSQVPKDSQTASDFINQQLALEADAREVLPYKFDKCTNVLGPLRQNVFACLTCSPPPASEAQVYVPAGICYSCSISCHGEHTLVELFSRRDFVCDCGTSRLPSSSPCTLRSDSRTGNRGVHSQEPRQGNHYNHNYQNRFCACGEEYDAETEKGTMFQCLGLGTVETGGCGEDWYHPECLMGLRRDWFKTQDPRNQALTQKDEEGEVSHPVPPGFPDEDDFDAMICYKCVESNPWIKKYAGTPGFLKPVFRQGTPVSTNTNGTNEPSLPTNGTSNLKRKASDSDLEAGASSPSKRVKEDDDPPTSATTEPTSSVPSTETKPTHKHDSLPPVPKGSFSLFLQPDFRDHICHCPACYPNLIPHPQLVEEEDTYEPSISSASGSHAGAGSGTRSHGTASLLDRGEAALSTMDRVKAIEGVMVYNHLRDKVKEFLKPYAESGQPVSAEDIKAYFEKLRGDEGGIREASAKPVDSAGEGSGGGSDNRREQSGY
ncbi:uncharacterized protein Z518_03704 [Rhinocladiella mackenziei CBS 650.93]|uniref:UBR-type domain-containing protein n=1 Tax=Rhinocladiella mackenziei CBS 650.93 TaxID=1442369 RepID=A0A0D2FUF0_9EURO|nr:uncharacterized protein Z518_03704 [Rhinocladiella mackenziei CBS 650.93]KIX05732.1 hypothetical protein Z518_03704 [Rhinocladiella mackenziei CBS 650.93]